MRILKKNEINESPITIGDGNKFEKETVIGHGSKIVKKEIHINDGSRNYEVASPDVSNIETITKILINRLGEKWTIILDLITIIGTVLGIPIGFKSVLNTPSNAFTKNTIVGVIPKFPEFAMTILILGFISFFAFLIITYALIYYRTSRCQNCGHDFAQIEYKPRKRRDVDAVDATERVEKRFYKCRYCGDKTTEKKFITISKDKNNDEF